MTQSLPAWAVQRVAAALETQRNAGKSSVDPADLARRTGLSKSLARRCLNQVRRNEARQNQAQLSC